ncbi:MAG: alpha/beta hydrolase [Chitinophagaceae bacterium]|nr:MAG: alpha/beta hydrolase [Chitinophagaceae bacterium]
MLLLSSDKKLQKYFMPEFFITINTNKICVHVFGSGPRLLIAFHGFKESGDNFYVFENILGKEYTLYAPDLPYSGSTIWDDAVFEMKELEFLMRTLLDHFGSDKFTLLGYSMGGRIALCAAAVFISQMEALVLLAPDGLKVNPWYYFVTQTKAGHALFHHVVYHHALLHFIIEAGFKLHLTNESIYKFVKMHTDDKEQRMLVYRIWTCMKNLSPDIPGIKKQIKRHHLPVIFIFGKYDRIFPSRHGKIFEDIPTAKILTLDYGHQLLKPETGEEIFRYLSQNNY